MFYFVVHYAYFLYMLTRLCIFEYTTLKMLIGLLYFENSAVGVTVSWWTWVGSRQYFVCKPQVGSVWVGSRKMDPRGSLLQHLRKEIMNN